MTNLPTLYNNYLNYCEQHRKLDYKTLNAYRTDLVQFQNFSAGIADCTDRNHLNNYINWLNESYSPKSVRRKIASLKAFFHYLRFEDIISQNPFEKVDIHIKQPKPLPKTIPRNIIEEFFTVLYQEQESADTVYKKQMAARDIAVFELLFSTGMRVSELCSLRREQLDLCGRTVDIWGKGKKERIIFIDNPNVINAMECYIQLCNEKINETGYLFINRLGKPLSDQSVRMMIHHYCDIASIRLHITPHMFRHSFATMLLESDVDIRCIQKILGHTSITTTEIYTSVSIAKQKEILSVKHPRNKINVAV